jgi:hypothetical protein
LPHSRHRASRILHSRNIGRGLGDGLAKGLKAATVGIGALFVAGGLAVKAFITSQKESLRLAKTLKATGNAAGFTAEQLEAHAMKLQDATTVDDTDIKKVQALLASFTNITGENFTKATKAVLDMSSAMGIEVSQAAIQMGKALNDPAVGINAMARSGVSFTKEQKAMIKAMTEAGEIAAAQNEIFQILRVNGIDGNADATAALSDQWEQSKNVLEDIVVDLGKAIAGMFGLTGNTTTLTDKMKELRGEIKKFTDDGTFEAIGAVLIPVLKKVARFVVVISHGITQLLLIPKALTSFGEEAAKVDAKITKLEKSTKRLLDVIENIDSESKIKKTGDAAFEAARKLARKADDLAIAKQKEAQAEKDRAKAMAKVKALQEKKKKEVADERAKLEIKRKLKTETSKLKRMENRLAETIKGKAKAMADEKAAADALRKSLEVPKQRLAAQEQELANLERARDAIDDIANIQTVGLEDLFSSISRSATDSFKKGLADAADLDVESQRAKIKKTQGRISEIETKSREEAIKKAAMDQIKNQEEQISLQKQTIKAIKEKGAGSVFSSD